MDPVLTNTQWEIVKSRTMVESIDKSGTILTSKLNFDRYGRSTTMDNFGNIYDISGRRMLTPVAGYPNDLNLGSRVSRANQFDSNINSRRVQRR